VLSLIAEGTNNTTIAEQLVVSVKAVLLWLAHDSAGEDVENFSGDPPAARPGVRS